MLLLRIRKGDVGDGATVREVYRKQWTRLSAPEEVSAAAAVLEDYGWLRVEKVETGGVRPPDSDYIRVSERARKERRDFRIPQAPN